MSRSELTIEDVIDRADDSHRAHSLARWTEAQDRVLDQDRHRQAHSVNTVREAARLLPDDNEEEHQTFFEGDGFLREGIFRPILDWVVFHARLELEPKLARRGKPKPTHGARWDDEIAALRAFYDGARRENSATARAVERFRLGIVKLSSNRPEPMIDPHLEEVRHALTQTEDVELLRLTYVELDEARFEVERGTRGQRKRFCLSASQRPLEGDEVVGEALAARSAMTVAFEAKQGGSMPLGSQLLSGAHVTSALLVAEKIGALRHPNPTVNRLVDEEDQQRIAKDVGKRTSVARKQLRRLLQAITLDVTPKYLIPQAPIPTSDELYATAKKRGDRAMVSCCMGEIVLHAGVRQPCRWVLVPGAKERHPSAAWVPCSACSRPVVPGRVRAQAIAAEKADEGVQAS